MKKKNGRENIVPSREKTPSTQMETQKRRHEKRRREMPQGTMETPPPGDPLPRGPSKPSPGGHLLMSPARRVRLRRSFCSRGHLGLPCGAGVVRSHGRGGSGGARENGCSAGHTKTEIVLKIQSDVTTTTTRAY